MASDSIAGAWGFTQWDMFWLPWAVLYGMTILMLVVLLIALKHTVPFVAPSLQTAEALAALHRAGFLHGDLKPDNLRLTGDGTVVLLDLGFAHRPGENAFGARGRSREPRSDGACGCPSNLAATQRCASKCSSAVGSSAVTRLQQRIAATRTNMVRQSAIELSK